MPIKPSSPSGARSDSGVGGLSSPAASLVGATTASSMVQFSTQTPTPASSNKPKSSPPLVTYYECDYDLGPSDLYQAIEAKQYQYVRDMLANDYEAVQLQAATWVVRKEPVSGQLRWRLLPLHACMIFSAPLDVCLALVQAFPAALSQKDDQGMLPLHLAFRQEPLQWDLLQELLSVYPTAATVTDRKGRTPLLSAAFTQPACQVLQLYLQIVLETHKKKMRQQQRDWAGASSNRGASSHPWLANQQAKKGSSPERSPEKIVDNDVDDPMAALRQAELELDEKEFQIQRLERERDELLLQQQQELLKVNPDGTVEINNTVHNADFYYKQQNATLQKLLKRTLQQQQDMARQLDDLAAAHQEQAQQRAAVLLQVKQLEHDTQATCDEWRQAMQAEHDEIEQEMQQILQGRKFDVDEYEGSDDEVAARRKKRENRPTRKLSDGDADDKYSAFEEMSVLERVSSKVVRNILETSSSTSPKKRSDQLDPVGDSSFTTAEPSVEAAITFLQEANGTEKPQDIPVIKRGGSTDDDAKALKTSKNLGLITKAKQHLDSKGAKDVSTTSPSDKEVKKDKTESEPNQPKKDLVGKVTVVEGKGGFEGMSDVGTSAMKDGDDEWTDCTDDEAAVETAGTAEKSSEKKLDIGVDGKKTESAPTPPTSPKSTKIRDAASKKKKDKKKKSEDKSASPEIKASGSTKEKNESRPNSEKSKKGTSPEKTAAVPVKEITSAKPDTDKSKTPEKPAEQIKEKAQSKSDSTEKSKRTKKETVEKQVPPPPPPPQTDAKLFTIGDEDEEGITASTPANIAAKTEVTVVQTDGEDVFEGLSEVTKVEVENERKQNSQSVTEEKKEAA